MRASWDGVGAAGQSTEHPREAARGDRGLGAWESPAPYPLAEGMQDHLIALAVEEAAETDRPVVTDVQPWS